MVKEKELCVDANFLKGSDLPYTTEDSKWEHNAENMINDGFPLQIELSLNTSCNFKCPFCYRESWPPKVDNMDLETAYDILRQCKEGGLESVKVQYEGEPLLYPYLIAVIAEARFYGIYVHFNTNGYLLDGETIARLLASGVNRIVVSIDSSVKEVYEKLRVGGNFEQILTNMRLLRVNRDVLKAKTGIEIWVAKQDLNREELESGKFHEFWKPYVDSIRVNQCFDMDDATEDDTVLPDWHCGHLWQRLVVLCDGQVTPCCCGIDYHNKKVYSVGNVRENSLKEIWNSKRMKVLREIHRKGQSHLLEMCRKCRLRKLVIKMIKEGE